MNPSFKCAARIAVVGLVLAVTFSCSVPDGDRSVRGPVPAQVSVRDGFEITTFIDGLSGPTQATFDASGRLLVAELDGAENDATGRIIAVDPQAPDEREVLVTGLDKPTGLAVIDDALWIMERRRLTVGPLADPTDRTVVLDELPWNGRSEGTLTETDAGGLLYNTSGAKRGATIVEGSASIFEIVDGSLAGAPYNSGLVATGFKHAYARTYTSDQVLFSIEMSDGRFDGSRAADELVRVEPGDDGGWPRCVGNNRAVTEFGGSESLCDSIRPSHALFDAGATPTAVAVAPWSDAQLVVSLWITGEVVTVPVADPDGVPWQAEVLVSGIESPQYLLQHGTDLLVIDHESGKILSISEAV